MMLTSEDKYEALCALYEEYADCERCPALCQPPGRCRNNVVFGSGNPDANLMIVSDAPEAPDDRDGAVFAGLSGELLSTFLTSVGTSREEVFITYAVMCRPTQQADPEKPRNPAAAEVKNCLPRLHRMIEIIDPFVVLLLGASALQALVPMPAKQRRGITAIAEDHSIPRLAVKSQGACVEVVRTGFATHHPSYLLRPGKDANIEGSPRHMSFKTYLKAITVADYYAYFYHGTQLPLREYRETR